MLLYVCYKMMHFNNDKTSQPWKYVKIVNSWSDFNDFTILFPCHYNLSKLLPHFTHLLLLKKERIKRLALYGCALTNLLDTFFFVFVKMFQVSLTWLRGEWHIVDVDPTCWISVSDLLTSHAAGALYQTPLKGQQGQAHCQAHRPHGCYSFSHFLIYLNILVFFIWICTVQCT